MTKFLYSGHLLAATLIYLASCQALASGDKNLALFNLSPKSILAVGLDGDLLYTIRSDIEQNYPEINVLPRRQMELSLSRMGGAQVDDTAAVLEYGAKLGTNFVLTGTIDRQGSLIVANLKLVDIDNGGVLKQWQENFINKAALVSKADQIAKAVVNAIATSQTRAISLPKEQTVEAFAALNYSIEKAEQGVEIRWTTSRSDEVAFVNIYRSTDSSGPFQLVGTVAGAPFLDTSIKHDGQYFYRLGVTNFENVEEFILLPGFQFNQSVGSALLKAPIILQSVAYLNGFEIKFVPSLDSQAATQEFRIYLKSAKLNWFLLKTIKSIGELEYTYIVNDIAKLGTEYQIAVTAFGADGESDKSEMIDLAVTRPPVIEGNPLPLLRKAEIFWDAIPSQADGINIFRRSAGEIKWTLLSKVSDKNINKYTDAEGLDDGKTYFYALSLYDRHSETAKSNILEIMTKAPFSAPTGIEAAGAARQIALTWNNHKDSDVVKYQVYRGTTQQIESMQLIAEITKAGERSHYTDGIDEPLQDNTEYFYSVVAVNQLGGIGEHGEPVFTITKKRPDAPEITETVADESDYSVSLKWTLPQQTDLEEFRLLRQWEGHQWQEIAVLPVDQVDYLDQQMKPFAKVHYRIMSVDVDGLTSDYSNVVTVDSPKSVILRVAEDNLLRQINLEWNSQSLISGFNLYRKTADKDWRKIEQIKKPDSVKYQDKDVRNMKEGTVYSYRIEPYDEKMTLGFSNVVEAKTKELPEPPLGFTAISGEVKEVSLSWEPSSDPDVRGYVLYKEADGKFEQLKKTTTRKTEDFKDNGGIFSSLDDGTTYNYKIASYNTHGVFGPESEVISAKTKPLPEPVQGVQIAISAVAVELFWDANSETDIARYNIYRGSSCQKLKIITSIRAENLSYSDDDVKPGRSYCYAVTAECDDGLESKYSEKLSATIEDPEKETK